MGRTIIVGDVHGCRAELEALLDRAAFTLGDRLVFVGDLVARGPDSLGVLDIARRSGAVIVRGNHEEKLLAWRAARRAHLRGKGKRPKPLGRIHAEVIHALRPVDWTLLSTSPLAYDLPEHGARVVHAGVVPGLPFDKQARSTLLKIRTVGERGEAVEKGGSVLWGSRYAGPPHIVFGHNAAPEPQMHAWATGLDTGCVYGGRLTAMILADGEEIPIDPRARRRLLVSLTARRAYYEGARRVA
jgi:hypothetical protein